MVQELVLCPFFSIAIAIPIHSTERIAMIYAIIHEMMAERIQDFPREGRQPLRRGRKPIIWPIFFQKLNENERN